MSEQPTLVKAHPLEHFALGKLSTRESLIRQIQEAVSANLYSEDDSGSGQLDGPLGEQIAIAAGNWNLEFVSPENVARGICTWLEKTFLQKSPQEDGSRRGTEDASHPPCNGGGDGSRVAASLIHLPTLIRDEFKVSASEARRLIQQGGVAVDGERLSPDELDLPAERIDGAELRIGRKRGKRIDLKEGS